MPTIPILPEEIGHEALLANAQMRLLTYMEWPNDAAARDRMVALTQEPALERRVVDFDDPPFADRAFLLRRGTRADPYSIIKEKLKPVVRAKTKDGIELTAGQISGALLLEAWHMREDGGVTLGKCKEALSKRLTGYHRSTSSRPQDLAPHWTAYKDVASFHAAEIDMLERGARTNNLSGFRRFLCLADMFRRFGEGVRVRNVGPLLNPETSYSVARPLLQLMLGDMLGQHRGQLGTLRRFGCVFL